MSLEIVERVAYDLNAPVTVAWVYMVDGGIERVTATAPCLWRTFACVEYHFRARESTLSSLVHQYLPELLS